MTVSVIIPTYRPDETFLKLLARLRQQTRRPDEILVINTQEELFMFQREQLGPEVRLVHIPREDFDHGGTRDMAARMTTSDLLIFMTMDAVPADRRLIERLLEAFEDPLVAAAYARQLPRKDAGLSEQMTRRFNYGPESRTKTAADLPALGIKTYFCSDVCAAWRRDRYLEAGGFVHPVIFNEDMILAHSLIQAGWGVRYCAEARVIHSHSYGAVRQFRRNFDLGVSHAMHPEVFSGVSSESEGIRMVRTLLGTCLRRGALPEAVRVIWQSGAKYLGYRLGKGYERLPGWLVLRCTDSPWFWRRLEKVRQ